MKRTLLCVTLGLALFGFAQPVEAQVWKKLKEKAKERIEQKTDEGIDKALDEAENAVKCVVSDKKCIAKAEEEGKEVILTDAKGKTLPKESQSQEKAATSIPGEGAWANYDFVPGERVIFFDDFASDVVGNFPQRLEFGVGTLELVDWQGRKFLRSKSDGFFFINLPETLPDRFTFEADVFPYNGTGWGAPTISFAPFGPEIKKAGHASEVLGLIDCDECPGYIRFSNRQAGYGLDDRLTTQEVPEELHEQVWRLRVMADGKYVKVFVNELRVANVPNADLRRSNMVTITAQAYDGKPLLIGNIRVAAGGRKLYDALSANGRVATQGIFFDTGSDRLRPESTPTLKEIGAMLSEHPELRLLIEGHTDNVGDDAANLTLSQKRADAVKAYLVEKHQVDTARLETKGFGETKPAAKNETPEGRQNNRRVELVKL